MGSAKDIVLKPIDPRDANRLMRRLHYSGKVVNNSQLHIGVFYSGKLEGALQFGPSLDKRKIQGLVKGTQWHEFIELNRLAFSDVLPRNSESRALAVSMRIIRKHAPQVKWVISFADATQCGDGAIYRAAGFVLTGIKENDRLIHFINEPSDSLEVIVKEYSRQWETMHPLYFQAGHRQSKLQKRFTGAFPSLGVSEKEFVSLMGAEYLKGFQLRYIYFIDKAYRERLTVPEIPFSEIDKMGAGMYKGQRITRGRGEIDNAPHSNEETGGASPTRPLKEVNA